MISLVLEDILVDIEKVLLTNAIKNKPHAFSKTPRIYSTCTLCGKESKDIFYTACYEIFDLKIKKKIIKKSFIDSDCYFTVRYGQISFAE